VADLKNVLVSGDAAKIVHIERLTVNVANAGGIVLNVNDSNIPESVRKQINELLRTAGR
jgi:hypothetical protein